MDDLRTLIEHGLSNKSSKELYRHANTFHVKSSPSPLMKSIFTLLIVGLMSLSAAQADQTFNYPEKDSIFSISFPDEWKVELGDDSLSASSKDELANMELLALDAAASDEAIKIAKESLKEEMEGLKFTDEPETGELNGIKTTFINAQVTLEGVKMAVNCCIFSPKGADKFFMLFNVVPMDSLKEHGEDIGKVLNSIKGK